MPYINRLNINELRGQFDAPQKEKGYFLKPDYVQHLEYYEPYRTETYGIGLVLEGQIRLKADLQVYEVAAPALICMGPQIIRAWEPIEERFITATLFVTPDFLLPMLSDSQFLSRFSFFHKNGIHAWSITEAESACLQRLFDRVEEIERQEQAHTEDLLRAYTLALMYEVASLYAVVAKERLSKLSKSELLVRHFKDLVAQHFRQERKVKFYAEQLFLHPKHLSQTLKEQTGKTASEWITEIVILEAKVLLQDAELTIGTITDQLNFPDASTFGKYFEKSTQQSPSAYRKNAQNKR